MDSERIKIKTRLLNYLVFVDDPNKQSKIIELLKEYEAKIPDTPLHDKFQNIKRKKMDYEELCNSYVEDLLERKLNNDNKAIIEELFSKLTPIVKEEPQNWWDRFISWFKNSTGIN